MNPIITEPHAIALRAFGEAVAAAARSLYPDAPAPAVAFEAPRRPEFGDFATNVAFSLAKFARRSPQDVATALVAAARERLGDGESFASIDAVAGFVNLRFTPQVWQRELAAPRKHAGRGARYACQDRARRARLARVRQRESDRSARRRARASALDRRCARQRDAVLRIRRLHRVDIQRCGRADRAPREIALRPLPANRRSGVPVSRRRLPGRVPAADRASDLRSRRTAVGNRSRSGMASVFRGLRTRRDRARSAAHGRAFRRSLRSLAERKGAARHGQGRRRHRADPRARPDLRARRRRLLPHDRFRRRQGPRRAARRRTPDLLRARRHVSLSKTQTRRPRRRHSRTRPSRLRLAPAGTRCGPRLSR